MLKLLDMSRYPEHDPANAFVIPQLVFGRNKPKYPATREACVAEGHHHFYFLDGLAAVANDREGLPDEVEANRDHLEHELIDAVKEMLEEEEEEEDDGGAYVPPLAQLSHAQLHAVPPQSAYAIHSPARALAA